MSVDGRPNGSQIPSMKGLSSPGFLSRHTSRSAFIAKLASMIWRENLPNPASNTRRTTSSDIKMKQFLESEEEEEEKRVVLLQERLLVQAGKTSTPLLSSLSSPLPSPLLPPSPLDLLEPPTSQTSPPSSLPFSFSQSCPSQASNTANKVPPIRFKNPKYNPSLKTFVSMDKKEDGRKVDEAHRLVPPLDSAVLDDDSAVEETPHASSSPLFTAPRPPSSFLNPSLSIHATPSLENGIEKGNSHEDSFPRQRQEEGTNGEETEQKKSAGSHSLPTPLPSASAVNEAIDEKELGFVRQSPTQQAEVEKPVPVIKKRRARDVLHTAEEIRKAVAPQKRSRPSYAEHFVEEKYEEVEKKKKKEMAPPPPKPLPATSAPSSSKPTFDYGDGLLNPKDARWLPDGKAELVMERGEVHVSAKKKRKLKRGRKKQNIKDREYAPPSSERIRRKEMEREERKDEDLGF